MHNYFKFAGSAILLSSIATFTGCSSDDASGPAVPANAVTIDDTNAATLVASTTQSVGAIVGAETSVTPATAMAMISDRIASVRNRQDTSGADAASGVAFSDTYGCFVSGTVTEAGDETDNGASGGGSGSVTYNMCDEGFGVIIDGVLNFTYSWNGNTWNDNATGSLTFTIGSEVISLTGITFAENGDDSTGDYTTTAFSFTYDPSSGGGFSAQLSSPLTGNEFMVCPDSPDGGVILLTGAGGSQAKATVNANGTVTVEAGTGALSEVPGSPFSCAMFF